MLLLTWSLWYDLFVIISLIRSAWHGLPEALTHPNTTNLTWNSLSDNIRQLARNFPHQSVVNISPCICSPLKSIGFIVAQDRWSLTGEYCMIYRTTAIGFQYQISVAFHSIWTALFSNPHPGPSISSMSAKSWQSWSWYLALVSGTICLCLTMLLSCCYSQWNDKVAIIGVS